MRNKVIQIKQEMEWIIAAAELYEELKNKKFLTEAEKIKMDYMRNEILKHSLHVKNLLKQEEIKEIP